VDIQGNGNATQFLMEMSHDIAEIRTQQKTTENEMVKISGLLERLIESEVKLQQAVINHGEKFDRVFQSFDRLEARVSSQEKELISWVNRGKGVGAVLLALSVVVTGVTGFMLKEIFYMRDTMNVHDVIIIEYMKSKHGK